ncbi:MAG: hypothetical protein ACEQSK_16740 [Sphingomonadaceae bacterium]
MGALVVCCGLLAAPWAHAGGDPMGDRGARRDDRGPAPVREVSREVQRDLMMQSPQGMQVQRGVDPRQLDPRSYEARAEEQRRAMEAAGRNAEMGRRAGRLTPDERRDLRRQINEAGQDLYANPPQHR